MHFPFCRFPLTGGEQYGIIIKILTVCRCRNGACAHARQSSDGEHLFGGGNDVASRFLAGESACFFSWLLLCAYSFLLWSTQ